MKLLVKEAIERCGHDGKVLNEPSQEWVRIAKSPVLVDNDPEGREINNCPNQGLNIKRCMRTLAVQSGYSTFVRIGEHKICLDSLKGFTDGTPPGAVYYTVRSPGQEFVAATA